MPATTGFQSNTAPRMLVHATKAPTDGNLAAVGTLWVRASTGVRYVCSACDGVTATWVPAKLPVT